MKLVIGHLYPDLMNIYGDIGNIITLKKRAESRGIEVEIRNISIKDKLKKGEVDLFFFGGGQDQQQNLIAQDLLNKKGKMLKEEAERGVPVLAICGGYQLLGEYYKPLEGPQLPGIGLLPVFTVASHKRMVGNLVIEANFDNSHNLKHLVGFENHSGQTFLNKDAQFLGKVKHGFGNNGEDSTEGCIYKNTIGCYMHGSLLPKNPHLADWLIQKALEVKYETKIKLKPINDSLEIQAHEAIVRRFK